MSDSSNNTAIIAGLILAMVFLIAAPVTFFLVKRSGGDHRRECAPQVQAPMQQTAPPPVQQTAPPIIIAPVVPPSCPPQFTQDMYHLGWADARAGLRPDPRYCNNPSYQRGYSDFCGRYRPGFRFEFRVR